MRRYETTINYTVKRNKGKKNRPVREERSVTYLNPGLKKVHIGDDVWVFGKQRQKPIKHMVIYGPDGQEHHVWGETVQRLCEVTDEEWGDERTISVNRQGNRADESKVKIYILTHILDKNENWCFDLSKIPPAGKLKVIYDNGTVKNIEFNGTFEPARKQKYAKDSYAYSYQFMNPIGYRIN